MSSNLLSWKQAEGVMKTETSSVLFAGRILPGGGLSNERELVEGCPNEFKFGSSWGNYADMILFFGIPTGLDWWQGAIQEWAWKTPDERERRHQMCYYICLLGSETLEHEDKEAVAGWMLSEMVTEIPPTDIWSKKK